MGSRPARCYRYRKKNTNQKTQKKKTKKKTKKKKKKKKKQVFFSYLILIRIEKRNSSNILVRI
jgi:hypothetical protein